MVEMQNGVTESAGAGLTDALASEGQDATDSQAYRIVDQYVCDHPGGQEQLIPLLHRVQEYLGYLPFEIQEYVAGELGLSPVEVYSVISFYHFFTTTPRGRYQLKVCMGTACFVNNAQTVCDVLGDVIKLGVGEVSDDLLFSLEHVRCIGACGLAPAMMVNDETYGHLTPNATRKLVRKLKKLKPRDRGRTGGEDCGENEH